MAHATTSPSPHLVAAKAVASRLLACESGQDNVEYALLGALIALFGIVSIKGLSDKIVSAYTSIGSSLTSNIPHPVAAVANSISSIH